MTMIPRELNVDEMLGLKLDGIKLIEASAGTGKTYTIANLYLRYILDGRLSSEILVVTFTKAATEELRGRIRSRLYEALNLFQNLKDSKDQFLEKLLIQFQSLDSELKKESILRLQLALRSMDEAAISTIHSFCQRALREHALAGKYYFDSEVLVDDDELWQSAARDWWRRQTYLLDTSELSLLLESVQNFPTFNGWLSEIRKKPAVHFIPAAVSTLEKCFIEFRSLDKNLLDLAAQWRVESAELKNIIRHSKVLSRAKKIPYHADNLDVFFQDCDTYFNAKLAFPLPHDFKFLASAILHENSMASKRGQDAELDRSFFATAGKINEIISQLQCQIKTSALLEALDYVSTQVKGVKEESRLLAYQDQLELLLQALNSNSGSELAQVLRDQFPAAMIDEFQDTDSIQYEIFKTLYYQQPNVGLTLIGDPKQSIYSFRGGDIFTYMKAKNLENIQQYSLQTNWRSQSDLVDAVNRFFSYREQSFIFSDSIAFTAVEASPQNAANTLAVDDVTEPAMSLWHIPLQADNRPLSKAGASQSLNQTTASEIARLLKGGREGRTKINGQPLRSGDIAILVRTAYQGEDLRQVLESRGINSVTIGRDKVFESEEATGMYYLLEAVAHPDDRQLVRRALASSVLYLSVSEISDLAGQNSNCQDWSNQFQNLHHLWLVRGFIPMFQQLLQIFKLGQKLSKREQAERRLTNLLHLAELLQQQSSRSAGIDDLLNWFLRQMNESNSEEAELRLESDQALVKIVTIHKSKGLEYPVVFIPYLWSCNSVAGLKNGILHFHDDGFISVCDLGSEDFSRHCLLADKERLAEDVRLLYVALTRARSKVYLAWGVAGSTGRSGNSSQTALAYLLHSKQSADDLDSEAAKGFSNPEALFEELQSFVKTAGSSIELITLPSVDQEIILSPDKSLVTPLQARDFHAMKSSAWRINSFSNLTRDVHQQPHTGSMAKTTDAILNFPAGSHVGLLLHTIFEHLDFKSDIDTQCDNLIPRFAPRFGLEGGACQSVLSDWLKQVLQTELIQPGLSLSVLSSQQRLNEIAFDFALDYADINRLNELLTEISGAQLEDLSAHNFRGLITGVIDLVFEYRGKYYLADYKSNLLGTRLEDYSPDHLRQAMLDRRYDLQLLIYTIALHRYLRKRIPGYDYETHFGGAYYLFIRAMRPQNGTKYGVHFERPVATEIEALDQIFASTASMNGERL